MKRAKIIEGIRNATRAILSDLRDRSITQKLKFYEILKSMLETNTPRNKREIFYMSVTVFKSQLIVNRLVTDTARRLKVEESDLLISTSLKGLVYGNVEFVIQNIVIPYNAVGKQLIPDMRRVEKVICNCKTVLVIEKDTIFSSLINKSHPDVLYVCGRGYPCTNTLMFLKRIEKETQIYGIFDLDPFGLHIYTIYRYGSNRSSRYALCNMSRIGILASDALKYGVIDLLDLSERDRKIIIRLEIYNELKGDLSFMLRTKKKLEIESIMSHKDFDVTKYISSKIGRAVDSIKHT